MLQFQVNGSRVLSRRWDGKAHTETLTDGDRSPLLRQAYNHQGKPTHLTLGSDLTIVSFTYDK